jgi:NAD(P)-dependent dehydrogenase (short-subunit alcohol dehydrogenase family)
MALALAAAGAAVGVCARSEEQLAETVDAIGQRGGTALAVCADVSQRADAERSVATIEQRLGPLTVLVNNAGIGGPLGPLAEVDPDAWWRVQEVNLRSVLYCTRAALPGMLARGRGRIINTSSGAANGPMPDMSAYVVSKTALQRFTECLAFETQGRSIAVFAVVPGIVHTAMVDYALAGDSPVVAGFFEKALADGRNVPPDLAANLVVALSSGKADALSGRFISVAQNLDELIARAEEIRQGGLLTLGPRLL